MRVQNFTWISAALHELSTVHQISEQSTRGKRRYQLRFSHVPWKQFGELWFTNEVHVRTKFHKAEWNGSWVIVLTNFFALSRNGKKSENPVTLIFDLWPWNCLGFERLSRHEHARAKFHQAKCSSLWVTVRTEKKRQCLWCCHRSSALPLREFTRFIWLVQHKRRAAADL